MRFLFIVWILAVCSGCQPGQTVLKGHIENYRGESVFVSCYESNLQDKLTLREISLGHLPGLAVRNTGFVSPVTNRGGFRFI